MLEKDIIEAERELRDLRTAHNRGLGMLSFSEKSVTAAQAATSSPGTYSAVATFSSAETFPPIIQFAAEDNSFDKTPITIGAPTFDSGALTATVNLTNWNDSDGQGGAPIPTVYAVASIPIVSLTIVRTN